MYYDHSTCIAGGAGAARPRFAGGAGAARPRFAGGLGAARPQFAGGFGGRHAPQFPKIRPNLDTIFLLQILACFFENNYFLFGGKKPNLEEFGLFWPK